MYLIILSNYSKPYRCFFLIHPLPYLCRRQRTSSIPALVAALQPTFLASAIATMTTSCCAPPVTCFTSTSASSWATPRCLAALKGEDQINRCKFRCCLSDKVGFGSLSVMSCCFVFFPLRVDQDVDDLSCFYYCAVIRVG